MRRSPASEQLIYGNIWPDDEQKVDEAKHRLFERFDAGLIRAIVDDRRFIGLESTADAVDYMLTGKAVGKVIVDVS